jgi:hypothetical protein
MSFPAPPSKGLDKNTTSLSPPKTLDPILLKPKLTTRNKIGKATHAVLRVILVPFLVFCVRRTPNLWISLLIDLRSRLGDQIDQGLFAAKFFAESYSSPVIVNAKNEDEVALRHVKFEGINTQLAQLQRESQLTDTLLLERQTPRALPAFG